MLTNLKLQHTTVLAKCLQKGPESKVQWPASLSSLCHLSGCSVFSPLNSDALGTGPEFPTTMPRMGYSCADRATPSSRRAALGLSITRSLLLLSQIAYQNDNFLCVQGYEKGWAVLGQVTFHISSHTETEFYNCAELMSEAKKRGAPGEPPPRREASTDSVSRSKNAKEERAAYVYSCKHLTGSHGSWTK